jgi:hypothetical protein
MATRDASVVAPAYDEDYAGWIEAQVALLRAGRVSELDLDNIAEELGDLGRSDFRSLRSALAIIIAHMLKWDHQPERRSRSWVLSIRTQRRAAEDTLKESPCLRRRLPEAIAQAYLDAVDQAADETRAPLSAFAKDCPYSIEAILARPHPWPDVDG